MPTPNEDYMDAQIRHQIAVRRLSSGEWARALGILEKEDRGLATFLRRRLPRAVRSGSINSPEFRELIRDIKKIRRESIALVKSEFSDNVVELARMEIGFEEAALGAVLLAAGLPLNTTSIGKARSVAVSEAFQGRRLREWFGTLAAADQRRVVDAVQLGMSQGNSPDEILRLVLGTSGAGFRDGALYRTRVDTEMIVRTSITHASAASRELVWLANQGPVLVLRWSAVLDGRTSAICRARDGKFAPVGAGSVPSGLAKLEPPGARPPAHPNCRSIMNAVLIPKFGPIPKDVTYQQWLKRQPVGFQNEVLGRTKGKLFREGGVTLDRFVDRRGNELTIQQLRATMPGAFNTAGV